MRQLLFVLFLLAASPFAAAAPLKFQINAAAESSPAEHPLAGATLQLDFLWDPSKLPPFYSITHYTKWPLGDTKASLTVTGSNDADGTYVADLYDLPKGNGWIAHNTGTDDAIEFPYVRFDINGTTVTAGQILAIFPTSFFNGPNPHIPKAFSSSEATWWGPLRFNAPEVGVILASVVSSSAVEVPEPDTFATASTALLSLAALRRRK